MPNLLIESKLEYVPSNLENPKVLLRKIRQTIACTGSNFSRITKLVVSGSTDPTLAKTLLPIGADIGTIGYVLIENLGTGQVGVGIDPEITCNITDGGGGTLNLYSPSHGLSGLSTVTINGTTYSGYYPVDSVVDVDNFKVIEVFSINENAVPVYSYNLCELNLTEENFVFFRPDDGITALYAVALADFTTLEVIVIED